MATFLEYRDNALTLFGEGIHFAERHGFQNQIPAMREGKKRVEKNKLVIVAVGEARHGKSTLLSAFLEDDGLFPVDVEVTTCLVTVVCYGEREKVTVTFEDGSEKQISRSKIQDYVTEKRNEDNRKQAKWITVETPNPKLKDGLTFVDTPGVGSLNPQHTEVTYSFLPSADIVLFVSDAAAPLTRPELVFLRGVKKYCENFLFVLTKKDMNADYPTIMDANIQKIEEFSSIPKEKVRYIPVSGTMRLASLQNGSERMAKSSNFAQLETALMDTIAKNRADIIIAPPLGHLASCLKEIEKEIHIKATGLSGSAEEQEELRSKLRQLQEYRQNLLSEGASWQWDIQREIDNIGMDQNKLMTNFQNEAMTALEEGLKNPKYTKRPELLLNEIVSMALTTSHVINEEVYSRLYALKMDFENDTKLSLYDNIVMNELTVEDDPVIVFQKPKVLDSAITGGLIISKNTMGGSMAGGILGGIIGGIVGILGGPGGIAVCASYGAAIGSGGGGVIGAAKGAKDAINGHGVAVPEIRSSISRYINQVLNDWRQDHTRYIKDISYKFIKSLRDSIKQSQSTVELDIAELQSASAQSAETRAAEQEKLMAVKSEFAKLVARFSGIRNIKVDSFAGADITAVPSDEQTPTRKQTAEKQIFSHLEE